MDHPMSFHNPVLHAILISFVVLAGCASPPATSFLGASFPKVGYSDVRKSARPARLKLMVEFQRNGEHFPKGDVPLRDYSAAILNDTGVISISDVITESEEREQGEIRIVLNNIADNGTVAVETSHSMLPLWMVGKTITDAYEMSLSITSGGKTVSRNGLHQAIHTAIGNMVVPAGIESFPHNKAFGKMLEQMILKALADLQKGGGLAWLSAALPQVEPGGWVKAHGKISHCHWRHFRCYASASGFCCSASVAGPSITVPSGEKRLPWQGQSQLLSTSFQ
jgi:hypothetical protein